MSHSGLSKFKIQTIKHIVKSSYPTVTSAYQAIIKYKPVQNKSCTVTLFNMDTGEQLNIVANYPAQSIGYKLDSLFSKMCTEKQRLLDDLNVIRQRRIKRYENRMKRLNTG